MRYTVRPISDRTPFIGEHVASPFRASWSDTLDILDRELFQLDADDVVIEVDCDERHIRLDGMLRSDAKTHSPAVRLAFDSIHGPLTYATDRFISPSYRRTLSDWQHNVRAIALGLEALRRVDRYSIAQRGEQYAGWKAIEATPVGMGRDAACALLARVAWPNERVENRESWAPKVATDPEVGRQTWKDARARAHPDRNNGDRTLWDQVEQAGRVLGLVS